VKTARAPERWPLREAIGDHGKKAEQCCIRVGVASHLDNGISRKKGKGNERNPKRGTEERRAGKAGSPATGEKKPEIQTLRVMTPTDKPFREGESEAEKNFFLATGSAGRSMEKAQALAR